MSDTNNIKETTSLPTSEKNSINNNDDVDITSVKDSSNSCSINITDNSQNEKPNEKKLVLDPNYVKHKLPKVIIQMNL